MFGAPDLPRRAAGAMRKPGVGDHVCVCGGYVGLIVDVRPGGGITVARRHAPGWRGVIESDMLSDRLMVAPSAPVGFDEVIDPDWRRGMLG